MKEVKVFENSDRFRIVTIEEIKNMLNDLNIDRISIYEGDIFRNSSGVTVKMLCNDYQNPFVIEQSAFGNTLQINPDWYLEHQQEVEDLINFIVISSKKKTLNISNNFLINSRLITSLCHNENLEEVELAIYDSENYYSLSEEDYKKFKNSKIKSVTTKLVDDSLKENFDPLIAYNNNRYLVKHYKYEEIKNGCDLRIIEPLTEEDLENFIYLSDKNTFIFSEETIGNMDVVIEQLRKLNLNCKINIKINKNKEKFNQLLFSGQIPEYDNLYVATNFSELHITQYKKFEQILYDMIEPAKDLSPFEKFIYAYNVTKRYKEYKENPDNKDMSRNLYEILQNEYMVCVGFARMLEDLCSKLGIKTQDYGVSVDISYENIIDESIVPEAEEIVAERAGHARLMVYLKDEKYGLDGYYISDPTWDNDMEKDLYNYMAMTPQEMTNNRRYNWFNKYSANELLQADSIEKFYETANFLLSRKTEFDYSAHGDKRIDLMKKLIDIVKLDELFMSKLKEKYSGIEDRKWNDIKVEEVAYDLAQYVVTHTNKIISGETIMAGVRNVYEKAYGYSGEDLDKNLFEILEQNYERNMRAFPKRIRIDENGNETVIMNEENKFEIEDVRKTR